MCRTNVSQFLYRSNNTTLQFSSHFWCLLFIEFVLKRGKSVAVNSRKKAFHRSAALERERFRQLHPDRTRPPRRLLLVDCLLTCKQIGRFAHQTALAHCLCDLFDGRQLRRALAALAPRGITSQQIETISDRRGRPGRRFTTRRGREPPGKGLGAWGVSTAMKHVRHVRGSVFLRVPFLFIVLDNLTQGFNPLDTRARVAKSGDGGVRGEERGGEWKN